MISKDKSRAFRLQYKPKLNKWQANFQENVLDEATGKQHQARNAHLDIED